MLIIRFKPLWNVFIQGFGINVPGAGREKAGGRPSSAFSVDETLRQQDSTASHQRRVPGSGFSGARLFRRLEGLGF